jgi:hypothetical protein
MVQLSLFLNKKQFDELEEKRGRLNMKRNTYIRMKLFQPDEIEVVEFKHRLRRWFIEENDK